MVRKLLVVLLGVAGAGCKSPHAHSADARSADVGVDTRLVHDGALVDVAIDTPRPIDARPDAPPDAYPDAPLDSSVDAPWHDLTTVAQTAYVKASNTSSFSEFGVRVSMSYDGTTMAISAPQEPSAATGINGNQMDQSAANAGAVYVFVNGGTWKQQAYIKPSDTIPNGEFGISVALSDDGSTLAVGAGGSSSPGGGAVYVFTRSGATWSQQAKLQASNTLGGDRFGQDVALSANGSVLAVGAPGESSNATGVNGDQNNTSASESGAAYIFKRTAATWTQQAYIKASNTAILDIFGYSVSLSGAGTTLAVGAPAEPSGATGINGDQTDVTQTYAGAVYVFTGSGSNWSQQAYVKASNTYTRSEFGINLALSASGDALVVGAYEERSAATGINGDQTDRSAPETGAVYSFGRTGTTWAQDTYIKASNYGGSFGWGLDLSADGTVLVVGAPLEMSAATGINGNQADKSGGGSGAAYVFTRPTGIWSQLAYVKASNTGGYFGKDVALAPDGSTFVVGAMYESSGATGIDGDQQDTSAMLAGAAYVFQ